MIDLIKINLIAKTTGLRIQYEMFKVKVTNSVSTEIIIIPKSWYHKYLVY